PDSSGARPSRRSTTALRFGWPALLALRLAAELHGADLAAPEYKIKAAFLYNFAKLVEWPTNAFASAQSPFTIGVLGTDPFGKTLDEVVAGKKVHGRPVSVVRFDFRRDSTNCHLLFVGASQQKNWRQVFKWV